MVSIETLVREKSSIAVECKHAFYDEAGPIDQQAADATIRLIAGEAKATAIPLFVIFGTMLGLVRDGRPIAGDTDIDFGLRERDLHQLPALLDRLDKLGFRVVRLEKFLISLAKHGTYKNYVDIYIFRQRKRSYWCKVRPAPYVVDERYFNELLPLYAPTVGMVLRPAFHEDFLRLCYGNSWRVPSNRSARIVNRHSVAGISLAVSRAFLTRTTARLARRVRRLIFGGPLGFS